jgi:hypothetical protein
MSSEQHDLHFKYLQNSELSHFFVIDILGGEIEIDRPQILERKISMEWLINPCQIHQ